MSTVRCQPLIPSSRTKASSSSSRNGLSSFSQKIPLETGHSTLNRSKSTEALWQQATSLRNTIDNQPPQFFFLRSIASTNIMIFPRATIAHLAVAALLAAAGTPDGQSPAQETVCDGLSGALYGLCNAYCEAMDCDGDDPKASDEACAKVLENYNKKSGDQQGLPCLVPILPVRLVDGTDCTNGRVEVFHSDQWGTICHDGNRDPNNNNFATVICRQLGFNTSGAQNLDGEFVVDGTGPILLDDVQCTGSETTIGACSYRTIGTHNCAHHEDIGVDCNVNVDCNATNSSGTDPSSPSF